MKIGQIGIALGFIQLCLAASLAGQSTTPEKAYGSVALVVAGRTPAQPESATGTAVVVRENGVLLTAYHLIKDAYSVQVRFKDGEVFDQVQLLGVDARRDVAAIRIAAGALPAIPIAASSSAKAGEAIAVVSHPAGLGWSASTGVIAAQRLADEVPGAGSGHRLIQFTAPVSNGSSGGVLLDGKGHALGLIVGSLTAGQNLNFAAPIDNVAGLADAPVSKTFAVSTSSSPTLSAVRPTTVRAPQLLAAQKASELEATPDAPEKSDMLAASKEPDFILKNFRTLYVEARRAEHFKADQLKAELGRNKDFARLNVRIVEDIKLADTVLDVGYTVPWDYPFALRHQNTSMVLASGKGIGPFSGVAGATDVAEEFVKVVMRARGMK